MIPISTRTIVVDGLRCLQCRGIARSGSRARSTIVELKSSLLQELEFTKARAAAIRRQLAGLAAHERDLQSQPPM